MHLNRASISHPHHVTFFFSMSSSCLYQWAQELEQIQATSDRHLHALRTTILDAYHEQAVITSSSSWVPIVEYYMLEYYDNVILIVFTTIYCAGLAWDLYHRVVVSPSRHLHWLSSHIPFPWIPAVSIFVVRMVLLFFVVSLREPSFYTYVRTQGCALTAWLIYQLVVQSHPAYTAPCSQRLLLLHYLGSVNGGMHGARLFITFLLQSSSSWMNVLSFFALLTFHGVFPHMIYMTASTQSVPSRNVRKAWLMLGSCDLFDSLMWGIVRMIRYSPTHHPLQYDQRECSICCVTFRKKAHLSLLECEHAFHTTCLDRWRQKQPKCPCCKMGIADGEKFPDLHQKLF